MRRTVPGPRAHDDRLGRRRRAAAVADALQDVAVGDAGGREEAVVAADEVVLVQLAVEVVAGVERGLALVVVARPEAADEAAADRLDRGGGDDALGRAADPPQQRRPASGRSRPAAPR